MWLQTKIVVSRTTVDLNRYPEYTKSSVKIKHREIQCNLRELYTVSQKKETLYSSPYLRKILTDFHNSFTDTFSRKLAIKLLIKIPPHLKCVSTLPCEILKAEKLAKLAII